MKPLLFFLGSFAVSEDALLTYTEDDIRLCTIQRSTPDQRLGIHTMYHKHERFHYITLIKDFRSTLAYRAGLKSYDRVIELNDVNTEDESFQEFDTRFQSQKHLPTKMLVCSPATYAHYRSSNQPIRKDLPTVKRRKTIYGSTRE